MGAPVSGTQAAEQEAAEALLSAFTTIAAPERNRHAAVHGYWRSIRGERDLPTIRDLDPLQISDAGPCSVLLQLIGGGEDAEIRHIGATLTTGAEIERLADAPRRSLLSSIASKLPIVAISRDALAFEDEVETPAGTARCRVTLLPFSSTGPWVDYVYGFVTSESGPSGAAESPQMTPDPADHAPEMPKVRVEETPEMPVDPVEVAPEPSNDAGRAVESVPGTVEPTPEPAAAEPAPVAGERPAPESKGFDPFAGAEGFFGDVVNVELELPATAAIEKGSEEAGRAPENGLQDRLAAARAMADEARVARLQSDAALSEGLSAAYDFALDAEDCPEEYLRLVESRGLRIQLRSPMAPVVRLAFDGLCDEATIAELEGVLSWALKNNLPRGSLAARIKDEGGIAAILDGPAKDEKAS